MMSVYMFFMIIGCFMNFEGYDFFCAFQNEEDALNDTTSSDEYPSTKGIADNDSTSYKSSSDRRQSDIVPQTPPKCTPCTVPDDSFAAHVIIQEAHHLPTIPDSNGDRWVTVKIIAS